MWERERECLIYEYKILLLKRRRFAVKQRERERVRVMCGIRNGKEYAAILLSTDVYWRVAIVCARVITGNGGR